MTKIGSNFKKFSVLSAIFLLISFSPAKKLTRLKRAETMGLGCDALSTSFLRRPISGTDLESGMFYQIKMKSPYVSANKLEENDMDKGYITWDWALNVDVSKESEEYMYVLVDFDHVEKYEKGASWYQDSHWAFLVTQDPEWYHLVNCGYPYKYATWRNGNHPSNGEEEEEFTLIIDPKYPGNHSSQDFLFKPVLYYENESQTENPSYQLISKAHGTSIVYYEECEDSVEEGIVEADDSKYLKMLSSELFELKRPMKYSLFTFSSPEVETYNSPNISKTETLENSSLVPGEIQIQMCSYETENIIFALLVLWAVAMTVFAVVKAKKLTIISS